MTDSGATAAGTKAGMSLSHYYNASQLRAETWQRLKHLTSRLDEKLARKGDVARLKAAISDALGTLEPIETYWAFPGKDAFQQLRRLFELEEHHAVAQLVARIVRSLVSNSYRRRQVPLRHALDLGESEENVDLAELARRAPMRAPISSCSSSTTSPEAESRRSGTGCARCAASKDGFVYDVLIVPSFEDALIAVLLNYNIQTVVIRYSFPLQSRAQVQAAPSRAAASIEESELEMPAAIERGTSARRADRQAASGALTCIS